MADWNERREEFVRWLQGRVGVEADGKPGPGTRAAVELALESADPTPTRAVVAPIEPPEYLPPNWFQWENKNRIANRVDLDTIARSGCLLTCAAQIYFLYTGKLIDPLAWSVKIDQFGGFTERSLMVWDGVLKAFHEESGLPWSYRDLPGFDMEHVSDCLTVGIFPLCHVSSSDGKLPSHWVLITGIDSFGDCSMLDCGTGSSGGPKRDRLFGSARGYRAKDLRILAPADNVSALPAGFFG